VSFYRIRHPEQQWVAAFRVTHMSLQRNVEITDQQFTLVPSVSRKLAIIIFFGIWLTFVCRHEGCRSDQQITPSVTTTGPDETMWEVDEEEIDFDVAV
jgi:hypothetical protein